MRQSSRSSKVLAVILLLSQVVILTNHILAESIQIDSFCHQHGIKLIRADVRGVFGSVFCDFGKEFEVVDVDGESLIED